jgi:hypothetical protein
VNHKVQSVKRIESGLGIIFFPVKLLLGFVLHPSFLSSGMITTVEEWAHEWRGVFLFHFGHVLVTLAVSLIITASVRFMGLLKDAGAWLGFFRGMLGAFGALMLPGAGEAAFSMQEKRGWSAAACCVVYSSHARSRPGHEAVQAPTPAACSPPPRPDRALE